MAYGKEHADHLLPILKSDEAQHYVRCCHNIDGHNPSGSGYSKNLGGPAASGCSGLMTWTQANDFCNNNNVESDLRLCASSELRNDAALGTGCSYDWQYIWTSDAPGPGIINVLVTVN